MTTIYVIRNQNQHYLGRNGEWVDGSHLPALFRTPHRDVALNELVEVNLRDLSLRGELLACEANDEGYPQVEVLNPIAVVEAPAQPAEEAEAST